MHPKRQKKQQPTAPAPHFSDNGIKTIKVNQYKQFNNLDLQDDREHLKDILPALAMPNTIAERPKDEKSENLLSDLEKLMPQWQEAQKSRKRDDRRERSPERKRHRRLRSPDEKRRRRDDSRER
jgi:hypothetical protein